MPAEYFVRIFKGKYPKLKFFNKKKLINKKVLDLGCAEARHLRFLREMQLQCYGVDIDPMIIRSNKKNKNNKNIIFKVGENKKIPFEDNYFDILVSWNSCYYMGSKDDKFERHRDEILRVLKKGGKIILSIPKPSCFIFKNSVKISKKYVLIKNDYFKGRNGLIFRKFSSLNEILKEFKGFIKNYSSADIESDCFGLNYSWWIVVINLR